jgi:ABC-type transport system substrate-binding protein
MPALVARFETEADPAKRRALAEDMQRRILEQAPFMFLGQFSPAAAYRANLKGGINNGLHVFWNMRRQGG